MRINEQASVSWQKGKAFCSNLNLFPSIPPTTDEHELRTQRLSTRLFIACLFISLVILITYTSLVKITKTINIKEPTLARYSQLYTTHSQTLTCPCTQISINYDKVLQITYTLHQVCNSVFLSQSWFYYLNYPNATTLFRNDFRWMGTYSFQALNGLCQSINETIIDSLKEFYSNQYISASVTPSHLFQSQVQSLVDQFRTSITNSFLLSLSSIQDIIQSNALFSGLSTNYGITTFDGTYVFSFVQIYGNCACTFSDTCISPTGIYHYPSPQSLLDIPGFYIGCFIIESLRQSNLQCFYNQTFINQLQTYSVLSFAMNFTALDASLSSRYLPNTTIEELLDTLMIEEWNLTQMYDQYYNECQPIQCSYSIGTRNDIIYIVTTVIGIIGGLVTVLKLVIPRLVMVVRKKREVQASTIGKIVIEKTFHEYFV